MKKITFILIFLNMTLLLNAQSLKMSSNAEKEEKAFFTTRDSLFAPAGADLQLGVFGRIRDSKG